MRIAMDNLQAANSYREFFNKNLGVAYDILGIQPVKRLPRKIKKRMKSNNEIITHNGKIYTPTKYKEQVISVVK